MRHEEINKAGVQVFEPRKHLDKAIIAIENGRAIYDYEMLVDAFIDMGASWEQATDWVQYNCCDTGQKGYPQVIYKTEEEREENE
jgi:hypothetical protein